MPAHTDFRYSIDRAAGLTLDATCALRALYRGRMPPPHRRHVHAAIVALEQAQQDMFTAVNDPWSPRPKPKHHQLELL
jgi:hypothetical protein